MTVEQRTFLILGAVLSFLAVAAGAFGAHALKTRLTVERLNVFEIAVRYQMYHALALLILAWAMSMLSSQWISLAGWALCVGTFIFSGSLYCLVLFNASWWGAITPIGGVILLIGWALFALAAARS